jgi:hypothetical protein
MRSSCPQTSRLDSSSIVSLAMDLILIFHTRAVPGHQPSNLHPTHRGGAGVLACLDSFMNIAMEQTEEYVHGQLKAKYGDCFIRGNNGGWM